MRHGWGIVVLVAAMLTACSSAWSAANRDALRADVAEILNSAGSTQFDLTCQMVGTTRTGYCEFAADEDSIKRVADQLALEQRIASLKEGTSTLPPLAVEGQVGCLAADALGEVEGLPAYWTGGRPSQLALSSGGQFEYLLLLHNVASGQACVQIAYAYG